MIRLSPDLSGEDIERIVVRLPTGLVHLLNANHESSIRVVIVESANRIQSKGENCADTDGGLRYQEVQRGLRDEAGLGSSSEHKGRLE